MDALNSRRCLQLDDSIIDGSIMDGLFKVNGQKFLRDFSSLEIPGIENWKFNIFLFAFIGEGVLKWAFYCLNFWLIVSHSIATEKKIIFWEIKK